MVGTWRKALAGGAVALVAGALAVAAFGGSAGAASTHVVTFVPGTVGDVPIVGNTFAGVDAALAATSPTVPLPIAGLETIAGVPMVVDRTDTVGHAITFVTESPQSLFGTDSPFAGVGVDLLLFADWDDAATDVAPDLVFAVRAPGVGLQQLYRHFGQIPGLPPLDGIVDDLPEFDDVVLALSPSALTLDPAGLPPVVRDFFGVAGPALDDELVLDRVVNLLGSVDLSSVPSVARAAEWLGFDTSEPFLLAGSLADTAALLFDREWAFDPGNGIGPDDFSLDGPFALSSTQLPAWIQDRVPSFELRVGPAPAYTPSITVRDSFDLVAGGVTNHLDYEVSLLEARSLDVTITAPALTVPYAVGALGWDGQFTDVALRLRFDDGTDTFSASIDATVPLGSSSPRIHIAVHDDTTETRADVSVDGAIPVTDVLAWLGGPFAGADFGPVSFTGATVEEIELSWDHTAARDVLGFYARVDGIGAFDASLRTRLLLGIDDTPSGDPSLLVALQVDDANCTDAGGRCIHLHQVLPIPGGSLVGDLRLPAVNFTTILPEGAGFTSAELGPKAQAFLTEVLGASPADPLTISGSLQFSADVPLGDFADLFGALGVTPTSSLRIEGAAGFTLPDLEHSPTVAVLDDFHVEATLAGVAGAPPAGFPDWLSWPSTGEWKLFLTFAENDPATDADDTLAFGASVDGVTSTLFPTGTPTLTLAAAFEGTPAASPPAWKITASAAMGEWAQPFGISFLTIDEAAAVLTIEHASGVTTPSAELRGAFTIGSERLAVSMAIAGTSPPSATVRLDLLTEVSVQDVADLMFPGAIDLPPAIGSAFVGPASFQLDVTGSGEFTVSLVGTAGFTPFDDVIAADFMARVKVPGTGTGGTLPDVTLGVKPKPGLMLSHLLPGGLDLPVDFALTPDDPDSGFAFVFSTDQFAVDDPSLPDAIQDFFRPLYGGVLQDERLSAGVGVRGSFALPGPLDDFVAGVGIDPKVLLAGTIPLPDASGGFDLAGVGMELKLRLNPEVLPEFVDAADLSLGVGIEGLSLFVEMQGGLTLRFKQGMDAELAGTLSQIGLQFPAAETVGAGVVCPRGGFNQPIDKYDTGSDRYCFDRLRLTLFGRLAFSPPSKIDVTLGGDLTVLNTNNDPNGGWSPLGLDPIVIRQLTGQVVIGLDPAAVTPATPINIRLGLGGNFQLFGKDVAGAIQAGVGVDPRTSPAPLVIPVFDGVRLALPDGIEVDDFLAIQAALADAVGAPPLDPAIADAIPNIALKNLYFSLSPLGVQSLCIEQGLVLRGDLYVDPTEAAGAMAPPVCDPGVGAIPIAPDDLCTERKHEGCVAGVNVSLTPSGIIAEGSIVGFDLAPMPIRFDDTEVQLRLTPSQQLIKLAGGVELGPDGDEWAIGRMALRIEPLALQFAGQLNVFGFNALVDGRIEPLGSENVLDVLKGGINPNLELHVVLAAPELSLPGYAGTPDFSSAVSAATTPILDRLEGIVSLLDGIVHDMNTGNPLTVLLDVPRRVNNAQLGVTVPAWLTQLAAEAQAMVGELEDYGTPISFDILLNGVSLDGIKGTYVPATRTCRNTLTLGIVEGTVTAGPNGILGDDDDICWSVENFVKGLFVYPTCTGVVVDGQCYLFPPITIPGVCGVLFPPTTASSPSHPSSPGGTKCLLSEVTGEVQKLFQGAVTAVLDGFPGVGDAIAAVRSFLADPSTLFALECAELHVQLQALGGSSAAVGLDSTILGNDLRFGVLFEFDDMPASAVTLLKEFFAALGGTSSFTCSGVDDSLFGSAGLAFEAEQVTPPPVLGATLSPTAVNEGASTTATIAFDRALTDDDGARDVTIDWGDGTPLQTVTFAVGDRSKTRSHLYVDDNPTGTTSDVYTVRIVDTGEHGRTVNAPVTVRNVAPSAVTAVFDDARIDEHDVATLTVTWVDPGVADTHTVHVQWGDGTSSTHTLVTSGVELTHRYLDDTPSGTPSATYTVHVSVEDDDRGVGTTTTPITVDNVAPTAAGVTISPTTVREGEVVTYTIGFADVGTLDTHTVEVDWDGDGTYDVAQATAVGRRSVQLSHVYVDDDPTGTPSDPVDVRIRVTDDDTGTVAVTRTITVENVAPVVCLTLDPDGPEEGDACAAPAPLTIDEGDTVTLHASFSDPGLLDTHTIVIDWGWDDETGNDAIADTVITPPVGTRSFAASQALGDDGTFEITVTVVDDDTGVGSATAQLTVRNVDPTLTIDESPATDAASYGTVLADGPDQNAEFDTPTFLTRAGQAETFRARATDPGSDDLTFTWDWDASDRFDTTSSTALWLVNAPDAEPAFPPTSSPTMQPRDVTDEQQHTWTQPCLYEVGVEVVDDDGGSDDATTWVVVTGTDDRLRRPGWWYNQYDATKRNKNTIDETTLRCYMEIVGHMSRVFEHHQTISDFDEMRFVLNTRKTSDDREIMVRQLLAAWLNLAHGSVQWFDMVDTDGDRVADTPFWLLLRDAENARMDPASTRAELLAWEDRLEYANGE